MRFGRLLPLAMAALAVLEAVFAALVPPSHGAVVPLVVGVVAQLLVTGALTRSGIRPDLLVAAVATVAVLMLVVPSPWQVLLADQAVPWLPLAMVWVTMKVIDDAASPRQLQTAVVIAAIYLAVVGNRAQLTGGSARALVGVAGAAVPILAGLCLSLAGRLGRAREDSLLALAREREIGAERARAEERQRLALEMHDSMGHVLTLLVLQANVMTAGARDPQVRSAAARMSRLGTDGVEELRRLLFLMQDPRPAVGRREPDDGHAVGPDDLAGTLTAVVDDARAAGQSVDLHRHGTAPAEIPAEVAEAIQLVVQEGLTNARRHAAGSDVDVSLTLGEELDVRVRNTAGTLPVIGAGAGMGLTGIAARVGRVGGRCRHTPTEDGGFDLWARLPLDLPHGRRNPVSGGP